MHIISTFLTVVGLSAAIVVQQAKPRSETLHVSSVDRKQESGEYGATIHIRVIADSKTIRYTLTCDEMFPLKKDPTRCVPVEAGKDYAARIWPTAVDFGSPEPHGKYRLLYEIESQVEK